GLSRGQEVARHDQRPDDRAHRRAGREEGRGTGGGAERGGPGGRVKRLAAAVVAVLRGGVAAPAVTVRLLPDDPPVWHAAPLTAARTGAPNDYLVAPPGAAAAEPDRISDTYAMPPAELMARLDSVALAEPRTGRIAGGPLDLRATYV